jgi:hypothetical protein
MHSPIARQVGARRAKQKRRQPDRAARILLTVIAYEPEAVRRALAL